MDNLLLETRFVEKPWGRTALPAPFAGQENGRKIGEIWFPGPDGLHIPILTKYLFTSDKLSIQVHPDDEEAHARGLPSGKEECWYILDAEPGATLSIGTKAELSAAELRDASLSGAIEELMEWHPVEPGMLFHITPGTVHAIGPGISLIEVQQNIDLTYRLYDYGRPRELHLDDGTAVSIAKPFPEAQIQTVSAEQSAVLLDTQHFTLAHVVGDDLSAISNASGQITVIPLEGAAYVGDIRVNAGACALAESAYAIKIDGRALVSWG